MNVLYDPLFRGHEKVVQSLLNFATENNIDPNILFAKGEDGDTSLHLASRNGHAKVVQLLLDFVTENKNDPNILLTKDKYGDTLLHLAIVCAQTAIKNVKSAQTRKKNIETRISK